MYHLYLLTIFALSLSQVLGRPLKTTPIAAANNHLSLELFHHLYRENENVFYSPLSISSAFGMLYLGAKGDTANELREVLGYDLGHINDQQVKEEFEKVFNDISVADSSKYQLNIANRMVAQDKFNILNTYKEDLKKYYKTSIVTADFAHNGAAETDAINQWVSQQTHDKIKKLLDQPLDSSTAMVLLNAIYFKGTWQTTFRKNETISETFYNHGEEVKTIDMMHRDNKFNYTDVNELNSKLLEIPYSGDDISMYILLPNERQGFQQLKNRLDNFAIVENAIKNLREEELVHVSIPKFKTEASYSLPKQLNELGMRKVFTGDADLSGIDGRRDLFVSNVIHKAVIEVNEEGSEAAAATAIIVKHGPSVDPPKPVFKADHPFMFFIRDNRNGMILFMGQINKL